MPNINQNFDSHIPLGSFSSVGEGETANVSVATGGVIYDALHFEYPYSAVVGSEFDTSHMRLRVVLNEEDIVDIPVADLISREAYHGNAEQQGYFTMSFREIFAKTFEGDHITGLVTMPNDNLSIEVDITGTGASATVTLKAFADTRPTPLLKNGRQIPRTLVPKLRILPVVSEAGDREVDTMARGPVYKRVFIKASDIERLVVETAEGASLSKKWDLTKARNEYLQKRFGKVPQAGMFVFDPIVDGYARLKVLNTAGLNGLVFRSTKTAQGSMNYLIESVWPEQAA
jgi:Viral coat protein P2 N-terminal domain